MVTPTFAIDAPDGVVALSLRDVSLLPPDAQHMVVDALGSLLPSGRDASADGCVVIIPAGMRVDAPVRVTISQSDDSAASHILVLVGAGASASIVEELTGTSGEGEWSHACELFLADEARLEYVSLQSMGAHVIAHIVQRSRVGQGATVAWRNATLGAKSVEQDLRSSVEGHDGVSSVDWLFYAKGQEKYNLTARNHFGGRAGGGEITMRGVAEEKAYASADGMIEIDSGGAGTNTYLTQNVLMLDTTAKVDAIPGLEIKTNDVKASHSATVSRVTQEDLFYFAARGIPFREARRLYVQGFLGDLTQRMSDATVRGTVVHCVEEKYRRAPAAA